MDKYKIDGHKLIYHIDRLHDWLDGRLIYPIYVEVSPSGVCNHRCTFCAYDFVGYRNKFLDGAIFRRRLSEMGRLGVKSMLYSGEGEPLLNKDICDIVESTKKAGIDAAMATNGSLLSKKLAEALLPNITWMKVSINAGKKDTYARIHRTSSGEFDKVIANLACAAKIKRDKKYKCAIGMQILLLPENHAEVPALAKKAKEIGMDYLVVKPYSQHPLSETNVYKNIRYKDFFYLEDKVKALNDGKFSVIFRKRTMEKTGAETRDYGQCYAFSYWAHIDSAGNVWGCPTYFGNKNFLYGNINDKTFREIWAGPKRKKLLAAFGNKVDIKKCRINCRMDEINRYLWKLKHPPEHVNFI